MQYSELIWYCPINGLVENEKWMETTIISIPFIHMKYITTNLVSKVCALLCFVVFFIRQFYLQCYNGMNHVYDKKNICICSYYVKGFR